MSTNPLIWVALVITLGTLTAWIVQLVRGRGGSGGGRGRGGSGGGRGRGPADGRGPWWEGPWDEDDPTRGR